MKAMTRNSILQELAFKAIDFGRQTQIVKYLPELVKTQWLTTRSLEEIQITRLQQFLAFASQYVPFYSHLFTENRWKPGDFGSLSDLEKLPIITKDIIKNAPNDFRPKRTNNQIKNKYRHTGGSTGEPLSYIVSNDAFGILWAATYRTWKGIGYEFGDRMFTLGGASVNPGEKNLIFHHIYNLLRNNHTVNISPFSETDLNKIVDQLKTANPTFLYGYPSLLYLVANHMIQKKINIQSINRIVTTSELLFPQQRKLIEQAFHAKVFDEYGCPEAGLISCECDYHQGLHYAMEICVVEVVDKTNIRIPNGHIGRILATNLMNRAMCFIRYDTGDIGAISSEKCECGRGLIRIKNLEGRSRDLIFTPDKRYIHGVAINHIIYNHPWVDRYQIIQETSCDLILNLAVSREVVPEQVELLRSELIDLTKMNLSVVINRAFVETAGKKNRLIVSKIQIPDDTI